MIRRHIIAVALNTLAKAKSLRGRIDCKVSLGRANPPLLVFTVETSDENTAFTTNYKCNINKRIVNISWSRYCSNYWLWHCVFVQKLRIRESELIQRGTRILRQLVRRRDTVWRVLEVCWKLFFFTYLFIAWNELLFYGWEKPEAKQVLLDWLSILRNVSVEYATFILSSQYLVFLARKCIVSLIIHFTRVPEITLKTQSRWRSV